MSPKKHEILQGIVDDLLSKKLVRPSLSPSAVTTFFIPKEDETCIICVNSKVINKITVKYRFLIPRLENMQEKL